MLIESPLFKLIATGVIDCSIFFCELTKFEGLAANLTNVLKGMPLLALLTSKSQGSFEAEPLFLKEIVAEICKIQSLLTV